jgi:hypothetical protein
MAKPFRTVPRLCRECLVATGGAASTVAVAGFFDDGGAPTYYGILKRWTGAAWTKAKLMVYSGGSWVAKPLKRWTGSSWVEVDTTGP